ncbi:MAG: aminotransferase class I/II-fold pyridoxal phosphate-dependent enzyme [Clostridiales bacterium]|nr:aminotransferase class I/II-fold pyridoxal phosphate-dependent enzyme [Clostridiales bacterium]
MEFAHKLDAFAPSVFVRLEQARAAAREAGREIIDLSVGTPDFPPAPHIREALAESTEDLRMYQYAIQDEPSLIDAAVEWYGRRYGVALERDQVCGLTGSQDGLAHLPLALMNPGDTALLPDPGYPMFHTGVLLACGKTWLTPLSEEKGYLPDFDAIPQEVARQAKLMILSYPANPIGRLAPDGFFEQAVYFAKKHDVFLIHDNAYSELTYDGKLGGSFLAAPGALDVGVELNSLSKSYNLTGARISFALGQADAVMALSRLKSNIDYGIFRPVQRMAVAALTGPQGHLDELRKAYQSRRDALCGALAEQDWTVTPPEGTMFCWVRLPADAPASEEFALGLLRETGVTVVPGMSFGAQGDRFVRFALTQPEEKLREAARRIGSYMSGYTRHSAGA